MAGRRAGQIAMRTPLTQGFTSLSTAAERGSTSSAGAAASGQGHQTLFQSGWFVVGLLTQCWW